MNHFAKAIETTATVNEQGQLSLERPLELEQDQRVRVIILVSEEGGELDPDNTPDEVVLEGLREGLQQALNGQTIPLAQIWDGIDAE